jgi:hypothetical protein
MVAWGVDVSEEDRMSDSVFVIDDPESAQPKDLVCGDPVLVETEVGWIKGTFKRYDGNFAWVSTPSRGSIVRELVNIRRIVE